MYIYIQNKRNASSKHFITCEFERMKDISTH